MRSPALSALKKYKKILNRYWRKSNPWIKKHQHGLAFFGLLTLGLLTRFWMFGYPNTAVFDEVYFGKFVSSYFTHQYFFDIHPPLGKLLIAGFAWLFHYNPNQTFTVIGATYTGNGYMYLRFMPTLASALLPITVYSLAREFGLKTRTALLVGLAIVFENGLLTQGHFILIDSFLLLFGYASSWAYLCWRNRQGWWRLAAVAGLAGLAMSVKWTGLTFLALPILCELIHLYRHLDWKRVVTALITLAVIPLAIYYCLFAIHIALLNVTGDGDAFMTPAWQKSLAGSTYEHDGSLQLLSMPDKIMELNAEMYNANATLTAGHPYGSKWYSWPLMLRPISYWVDGEAQIWLFGNPFIWWGSTIGLVWLVVQLVRGKLRQTLRWTALFTIGAYLINMIPFMSIARVMFLYHYLIPLVWALLATGIVLDRVAAKYQAWLVVGMVAVFFIYAPFTYGISPSSFSTTMRTLMESWR